MEAILDTLWEYLASGFLFLGESSFAFLQHLHFLGPAALIALMALATVILTKILNQLIVTKRYLQLEENFQHWMQLRQEAINCEDEEKGKRMARNIDQAELNRAYYDYFFEGLLLGIARKIIPVFFMFAFINEYYRPERMLELFGQEHVLQLASTSGEPVLIGSVAYYFATLLLCYLGWSVIRKFLPGLLKKLRSPYPGTSEKMICSPNK